MAETFAFANQKGGVGKTTTTINLGAALARAGKRCLLMDLDPQANTTSGLGVRQFDPRKAGGYLLDAHLVKEAALSVKGEKLTLVPSSSALQLVAQRMARLPDGERRLAQVLRVMEQDFDFILVDCPPSLGLLTRNALGCCRNLVIPIQCEYFAMEGLSKMARVVQDTQRRQSPGLEIAGILLTMYDSRQELAREVVEEVRAHFQKTVFQSVITRDIALSEASSFGQSIFTYAPRSPGAWGYLQLAREVLKYGDKKAGSGT